MPKQQPRAGAAPALMKLNDSNKRHVTHSPRQTVARRSLRQRSKQGAPISSEPTQGEAMQRPHSPSSKKRESPPSAYLTPSPAPTAPSNPFFRPIAMPSSSHTKTSTKR